MQSTNQIHWRLQLFVPSETVPKQTKHYFESFCQPLLRAQLPSFLLSSRRRAPQAVAAISFDANMNFYQLEKAFSNLKHLNANK